jgi:nucleoside phosphorylase
LENILINIDGIAGRKAILKNAGFAQYFIAGLDFNLNIYEFITILVSKFKDYSVSIQRLDYHPLIALLDYLLKQPERYNLENTDIKFAQKIINIGKIKIQELRAQLKMEIPNETPTIDILIITALKDELNALKNCDNQSGKSWQELKDSSNYSYYKTTFNHKNGTQLNIVAARPVEIGENYTNNLATRLISELKPRCLAMTGVCAGNKKETFLGDVIVANRVFKFDYGKLVTHYESIGDKQIRSEEIFHDIRTYNLIRQWEFIIQVFSQSWLNTIQTPRPKSDYHRERWLLHKLYDFQQQPDKYSRPDQHPERQTECPDWRKVIQQLREKELLKTDSLELTEKAQKEINNERLEYLEEQRYKDPSYPQIHTGVIATTNKVQKDPQLFQRIEKLQRKILGVEMEGAAIGAVAEIEEIPIIIVKGVQDYADDDKNDKFRQYAAEVSARFLLAFLTTIELDFIIFSILNRDNIIQLELIFQRLFQPFDSIAGRRAFLRSAGIDDYFINSRDFNLPPQQFIIILVADLKNYRISRQNPYYHPLLLIIDHVINQPREKFYHLDARDIECLARFRKIGGLQIKKYLQNQYNRNLQ